MLRKIAGLALIILAIMLISSFVSSLDFSKTGFEGLIGEGSKTPPQTTNYSAYAFADQETLLGGEGGGGGFASLSDSSNSFNPPNVPLFFVEGLDATTNYLRLYTASKYVDGKWIEDEVECSSETIPIAKKFKVTPIAELNRYLPVSKDTKGIIPLNGGIERCYDAEKGVFRINSTRTPYYGFSTARSFKPTTFDGSASYNDPEIKALARKITASATTDFEKVKAIEDYLKNNYINTYVEKTDVREFLFETKKGTAREFATAFVLLAQSIGIPARAVFGYLADPVESNQTIFASDAYVWAEVKFKEGWVEFDPAPEGRGINTTTVITYVDSKLISGENFTVKGYVKDENGRWVSGYVEIFLKKDKKSKEGILVGIAPVNGRFEATLRVPQVTGRYSVQAHFTGSLYHQESWSDPEVEIYCRPVFNVTLPDRVPENFVLRGVLESTPTYTGKIRLCVDGSCRMIEVYEGTFSEEMSLARGKHTISLYFAGRGYLLPAEFKKEVEAGKVTIEINESIGEGENVTGRVLFNGEPVNGTVKLGNVTVEAFNGNFTAKLPLNLGKNEIDVEVPELLYSEKKVIYQKRDVEIRTQRLGDILRVFVVDRDGNPADGFVEVDGLRKKLVNGMADFEVKDAKFIVYSGSERYFPAIKDLSSPLSIYLLIPAAVAAVSIAAYFIYRLLFRVEELEFFVEKEHPELPNVWDVGEQIKIRLSEQAFVRFNGREEFTDSVILQPTSYGKVRIYAFKEEGRKRKRGELEIKIAPYSEGIAEIVRKLEEMARKKFERVESLTGREIMEKLGVKAEVLLNYFEQGVYGRRDYTRREFLEAFQDYLRVVKNEV